MTVKSVKKSGIPLVQNGTGLEANLLSKSSHNGTSQEELNLSARPDCLINTGGTCMLQSCSIARGPTVCSAGQCLCPSGWCSGADGRCYKGDYKLILDYFTIRNYRWEGEYMYASVFAVGYNYGLRVSKDNKTDKSRFRLYEMPDGAVIITNVAYPNYAITISKHVSRDTSSDSNDRFSTSSTSVTSVSYGVQLSNLGGTGLLTFGFEPSSDWQALYLYAPPGGSYQSYLTGGAVMIGSYRYPRHYLYVPGMSWAVDVFKDDPGDGALWIFDPPLPADFPLRQFEGRICSFDCSGSESFTYKVVKWVGIGVGIIAVAGLVIGVPFLLMTRRR
mmetsp:Transcript_11990/g.21961  ORF Transcript_11990/g.21961 Transcript_11990/m.21961 type:complete len:332 (+) Transcript_11990:254-1249(+)